MSNTHPLTVRYDFVAKFIPPKMRTAYAKTLSREIIVDIPVAEAIEAPGALHLRATGSPEILLDGHGGRLWKKLDKPEENAVHVADTVAIRRWNFDHGRKFYSVAPSGSVARWVQMTVADHARTDGVKSWVVDDDPLWREIVRQDVRDRFLMVSGSLYERREMPVLVASLSGVSGQIEFQHEPKWMHSDKGAVSFRFDQIDQARAFMKRAQVRGEHLEYLKGLEVIHFDPRYGHFDQTAAVINQALHDLARADGNDFAKLPVPALEAWIELRRFGDTWIDEFEPGPVLDAIVQFIEAADDHTKAGCDIRKVSRAFMLIQDQLDRAPRLRPVDDPELADFVP